MSKTNQIPSKCNTRNGMLECKIRFINGNGDNVFFYNASTGDCPHVKSIASFHDKHGDIEFISLKQIALTIIQIDRYEKREI